MICNSNRTNSLSLDFPTSFPDEKYGTTNMPRIFALCSEISATTLDGTNAEPCIKSRSRYWTSKQTNRLSNISSQGLEPVPQRIKHIHPHFPHNKHFQLAIQVPEYCAGNASQHQKRTSSARSQVLSSRPNTQLQVSLSYLMKTPGSCIYNRSSGGTTLDVPRPHNTHTNRYFSNIRGYPLHKACEIH